MEFFYHISSSVTKHSPILSAFYLSTCTVFRRPFPFLSLCSPHVGRTHSHVSFCLIWDCCRSKTQLFAVLYVKADLGIL